MRRLLGRLALCGWPMWWRFGRRAGLRSPDPEPQVRPPAHRPRILVVTPLPIHPVIHGAAVRISNLVRRMAARYDISLLVLGEATDDPEHRRAYRDCCERVLFHRALPLEAADDPWGLLPPAAASFARPSVSDRISALVDAHGIDIVQLEFAELGSHVHRDDGARTVLTEHDIAFKTQQRQRKLDFADRFDATARLGTSSLDGRRQQRLEILACAASDQVHCMSEHDRRLLAARLGDAGRLRVIGNGVDTRHFHAGPAAGRHGVLFVGSFPHLPNLDAFEVLVSEVWPAIRRARPDARLTVAGARPPATVTDWNGRDGITVIGEVDDLAPLYREHRVLIVPLRAGSGTRLKILEALASGLPVVSTTIGVEGLELSDPPELALADTPKAMATAVTALLDAPDDAITTTTRRGRELVERRYDWDVIAGHLHSALDELIALGPRARPLRIRSSDAPADGQRPEVSVIIPSSPESSPSDDLLAGLAAQRLDAAVEVIVVDRGSPATVTESWRAAALRVLSVEGDANQGATLNAGAAAARGRVLVFLAAGAIPAGTDWLAQLVAPFGDERAPAAVQGGITTQVEDGGLLLDPRFTRESVRWRSDHGGVTFDLANAALARRIWEAFPLPPADLLADRSWQRMAADHGLLILPCLAAAVRRVVPTTDPEAIFETSLEEGAAWRRLGVGYSLADLRADLEGTGPGLDAAGLPTPVDHPVHRVLAEQRPRGLFIGANPRTWRLAPRRYTRGR